MIASNSAIEGDELTEEQRKQVQLAQSEQFTMGGHVRSLLGMRRKRVAQAWELPGGDAEADDDMQILARDIVINEPAKAQAPQPIADKPTVPTPAKPSKLPLAVAAILACAAPSTAGVVMLPQIISAWHAVKPLLPAPVKLPDYVPILKPGKPPAVS